MQSFAYQSCKQIDKYRPETENLNPTPKSHWKSKLGPQIKLNLTNYTAIARIWLK